MQSNVARFTSKVVSLAKNAVGGEPEPPVQKGEGGYADWVIVALHGLQEYLGYPYRRLMDVLSEMTEIVAKFDLMVAELPDFTTVCTRKQDLKMRIWHVLLRLSAQLQETGDIQAIDATGFDRVAASQYYANRTNYRFPSVKTTTLVDCSISLILDIHCSMKQPHDTQIGWQVLRRNLDLVETITADKGYNWDEFHQYLREEGVRTVIKHREFFPLDAAHNARNDNETYHRRSVVESVFASLRRRFDDTIRARTWFGQFREIVLKGC
ncbi:IS5 family transposase [Halodesulfurarchaeum sp.]|uniref:IS5 family transposase n=1 Tax=Halodesulfurarchaeum sp. TaxID=1980530 RepID=UPI002FC367DD